MSEATEIELVREVGAIPLPAPDPLVGRAVAGRRRGRALIGSVAPATQAVAVAAGGFIAGAAVVGLVTRRYGSGSRALTKGRRGGGRRARRHGGDRGRRGELVQIVGTRSLLVDVHLLGGAGR